jgi:hypothetical protein
LSRKSETVAVEGLNETVKALQAIGVPNATIKPAALEAAELVASESRSQAPRRTGRLISSIKAAAQLRGAVVRAGGNAAPYSNPIHWGWFYDRRNNHARNIKPNPFMVRALGYKREDVIQAFEHNMKKLIELEENKQNHSLGH